MSPSPHPGSLQGKCVDPEGRFFLFYSERPRTRGNGDVFVVYQQDGAWSAAHNLGGAVNTADYEWTPALSRHGCHLFCAYLAGGNDSDLYQSDLSVLLDAP